MDKTLIFDESNEIEIFLAPFHMQQFARNGSVQAVRHEMRSVQYNVHGIHRPAKRFSAIVVSGLNIERRGYAIGEDLECALQYSFKNLTRHCEHGKKIMAREFCLIVLHYSQVLSKDHQNCGSRFESEKIGFVSYSSRKESISFT